MSEELKVVMGAEWEPRDSVGRGGGSDIRSVVVNGKPDHGYISRRYAAAMGLSETDVNRCVSWNDSDRLTFPEIAARLRENVLPRYTDQPTATPAAAQ